jgi:hypothetical protein
MARTILFFAISAMCTSCGTVVCNKYEHRCEQNKIEVCVGYEWQEIQDCSDYDNAIYVCQSSENEYFCEQQRD